MTRKLRFLFLLLFISVAGTAFGQGGEISGTVLDDKKEPISGAVVMVTVGGITKGGAQTDEDGKYVVKPLDGGRYDVEVKFPSYNTSLITGVIVTNNKITLVNVGMVLNATELVGVIKIGYRVPLIDVANPGPRNVVLSEQIEKMPTRTTDGVASTAPGVYSGSDGLKIGGGRANGTMYIVDGMVTRGREGSNVSQNSIDQIEVMTSGLSAKYGDAIGGVVSITTKGASEKYRGTVLLEHSVDGFNHNLVNAGISGPIYGKKLEGGGKKPIIGFRLGVDAIYDEDTRPTYGGNYALKPEVKEQLEKNPLLVYPNQSGVPAYRYASEFVRLEDLQVQKVRNAGDEYRGIVNGKIDFQLAENLNLTAGGSFNYNRYRNHGESQYYQSIFSPEAISLDERKISRGYIRLTQRFGKQPGAGGEEEKKPLISNAFYTLQADYQTDRFNREHTDHGRDFFKYGYVGKFNTEYVTRYLPKVDDSTGLQAIVFSTDREAVRTTFQRSEINPVLANYTSNYFNTVGTLPRTVDQVRADFALVNGQLPDPTYGVYSAIGNSVSGYRYEQNDQFAVAVDASFDLQPAKTRHAIQFGLSYQQRVERFYATGSQVGGGIWSYMRQLANSHISNDFANPVYMVNGQRYSIEDFRAGRFSLSPNDTVLFDRRSIDSAQTTFDKNLRAKLSELNGTTVSKTEYLNVDAYDPSIYSLGMFSADEILNSGSSFVNYQGYDYTGKKQSGQVNFNDFFTRKDANGNFTRDIGAYRPNYIAGYILDQFAFKDINFNVGLRIDRFDANTKVLKDPYSIYEVRTLGDARSVTKNPTGGHPANIGDDYVVYVGSNESATPTVVGYRNGDDWYDPYGRFIEDPAVLKQYSGGTDPVPFLVDRTSNISDEDFDPNTSFTDYTPQVNVMPRISFSFPISEVALFYAHYDVIVQRPRFGQYSTPLDYFYLANNNGQILPNSDLKPEKMFDYEVGFQQQLTQRSAITLSGFYKERKDMIQIRPYLYAVPKTYYVFGNRDFSTTKGLSLKYDLRRFNHLLMNVSYTLQFAEGSGSGTASGNGGDANFFSNNGLLGSFIAASLPNLRFSTPLDYDSRHMIVVNADYRYTTGEGPVVAGNHILQNAGVNFIFNTRSGEPYTRFSQPIPRHNVTGTLNGSRFSWHYNLDLRVDKDFNLAFGKKKAAEGAKSKNPLVLNAYVMINNVLNTRDVLEINGYTGRPDEDGFITSAQGVQFTRNQTDQKSFIDLYSISSGLGGATSPQTNYNPRNINLPRRINVGLQLNF